MRTPMALVTAVIGALIGFAPVALAEPPAPPAPIIPPPVQPANIGDLKFEATALLRKRRVSDRSAAGRRARRSPGSRGGAAGRPACGGVRHRRDRAVELGSHQGQRLWPRDRRTVRRAAARAVRLARLGPARAVDGDPADDGRLQRPPRTAARRSSSSPAATRPSARRPNATCRPSAIPATRS